MLLLSTGRLATAVGGTRLTQGSLDLCRLVLDPDQVQLLNGAVWSAESTDHVFETLYDFLKRSGDTLGGGLYLNELLAKSKNPHHRILPISIIGELQAAGLLTSDGDVPGIVRDIMISSAVLDGMHPSIVVNLRSPYLSEKPPQ
jgi:hypothetical protein